MKQNKTKITNIISSCNLISLKLRFFLNWCKRSV